MEEKGIGSMEFNPFRDMDVKRLRGIVDGKNMPNGLNADLKFGERIIRSMCDILPDYLDDLLYENIDIKYAVSCLDNMNEELTSDVIMTPMVEALCQIAQDVRAVAIADTHHGDEFFTYNALRRFFNHVEQACARTMMKRFPELRDDGEGLLDEDDRVIEKYQEPLVEAYRDAMAYVAGDWSIETPGQRALAERKAQKRSNGTTHWHKPTHGIVEADLPF